MRAQFEYGSIGPRSPLPATFWHFVNFGISGNVFGYSPYLHSSPAAYIIGIPSKILLELSNNMIHFLQSGNKVAKYILGGLLLLLSASMVTYLIPGFMTGSEATRSGVVASVAGNDIVTTDIQKAVQRQMQGSQISPDMEAFYRAYLVPQVARQMIQQKEALYE